MAPNRGGFVKKLNKTEIVINAAHIIAEIGSFDLTQNIIIATYQSAITFVPFLWKITFIFLLLSE